MNAKMKRPILPRPLALFAGILFFAAGVFAEPLALHPENPHYFLWRGKPAVLIGSGEHYGAVLNLDFDYAKYLPAFADAGMNVTRTFTGAYVEPQGAFKIERNTLAPAAGRLICPWARSAEPGYVHGGNKFDLTKWDDAFFARLKDFVAQAEKRGVIVEMNLFTPMYEQMQWDYSPMNARNNINGIGQAGKHEVYTLDKEPALLRLRHKIPQPREERIVPFRQIEFVPAIRVTRLAAARPRADEPGWRGRERVALDLE